MPAVWKRSTSVTIPNPNVLRGGRVTIWEAAPRCPKCDKLATPEGKCPSATGRRKWCVFRDSSG